MSEVGVVLYGIFLKKRQKNVSTTVPARRERRQIGSLGEVEARDLVLNIS